MKTVWQSVMRGIPVLVLQSSGRAADFIAHGYNITANKLKSVQKYIKLAMSYTNTNTKFYRENIYDVFIQIDGGMVNVQHFG